jgi:PPOX class probable F420-dependent enzyme
MVTLDEKTRAFLSEPRFAVLATVNPDGTPQQSVMWYDLDGDEILMNTKVGRIKFRNLRRDARVSFCVPDDYSSVTLTGTVRLIHDQAIAQRDIARLAIRYQGKERARPQIERFKQEQRVTIRMQIDRAVIDLP